MPQRFRVSCAVCFSMHRLPFFNFVLFPHWGLILKSSGDVTQAFDLLKNHVLMMPTADACWLV